MDARTRQSPRNDRHAVGSALILTVVVTSLLAIVGVLFVLLSRMDKIAASASSQDRQLDLAVKAVVAAISDQLVQDTPGLVKDQDGNPLKEYYDYPDQKNRWLASLEPQKRSDGTTVWGQISDVTGYIRAKAWPPGNVAIGGSTDPNFDASQPELRSIALDSRGLLKEQLADADGDGIADSKWVPLEQVSTGKGRPIYTAIRVIDHGGMLNVNTALEFDAKEANDLMDGSHPMQIDLAYLAQRGDNGGQAAAAKKLYQQRFPGADWQLSWKSYLQDVVWRFGDPPVPYTPFDISDELRLRYRYVLDYNKTPARIEGFWKKAYEGGPEVPIGTDDYKLPDWLILTGQDPEQTNPARLYDYRHISTVYSMDRLVDPRGTRMVNVNDVNVPVQKFYEALFNGIDPNYPSRQAVAAQLAANIRDFVDGDSDVTAFRPAGSTVTYYGLEPQPFIRQIGFKVSAADPNNHLNNEFRVELCNPFEVSIDLGNVVLSLRDQKMQGSNVEVQLPSSIAPRTSVFLTSKDKGRENLVLALYRRSPAGGFEVSQRFDLYLVHKQDGKEFYLDRQITDDLWFDWQTVKNKFQYYARADFDWHVLYQDMFLVGETPLGHTQADQDSMRSHTAGLKNYNLPSPQPLPVAPTKGLATVGDISRLLLIGLEPNVPTSTIGDRLHSQPAESTIRLDYLLRDTTGNQVFSDIFQYVTALDPKSYTSDPNEAPRVKGRININTAPAFVIDRLPWLQWASDRTGRQMGQAIVNCRNQNGAFKSIGDVMQVGELGCMLGFAGQEPNGPDLTPDGELGDVEARDLLFSRISNLITVRSDVFSAYILVRIGENGPQRRILAILDRSQVKSPSDQVRVITLQTVPDPR